MRRRLAINKTEYVMPSALSAGAAPFALGASCIAWLTAALLWAGSVWFLFLSRWLI